MRILFFLLVPFVLFGQKEIKKDSTWRSVSGGLFYEHLRIEYTDNTYTEQNRLLGDTAQFVAQARRSVFDRAESMAGDVVVVSGYSREIGVLVRKSAEVEALVGQKFKTDSVTAIYSSPVKQIGVETAPALSGFKVAGADITFSFSAGGQARYQIIGQPVRNCSIMGSIIRLNNYLGGGALDLYRIGKKKYTSLDGSVKMTQN